MFRPSTRQGSLLEPHLVLSKDKRERLEQSWAHAFRIRVMPHIDEEILRDAYHADNGRPNYPSASWSGCSCSRTPQT